MDKVLNRRYVLGAAICLCAGAVLGGVLVGRLVWQITIPIVLSAVGIVFLFCKKKFLFFALLSVAIGASILSADYAMGRSYAREGFYPIEARVESVTDRYVVFDEVSLEGEKLGGKVRGARSDFRDLTEGEIIKTFVKIEPISVDFFDTYSSGVFNDRIYNKVAPYGETEVTGVRKTLFEKIRERIAEPLYRTLSVEDAGISESLLFGDKSNLSSYDGAMIDGIGMSHVFAVSGLHVGFLTAAAIFLMKKLRVKRIPRIVVTVLLLVFYGFLTGFPAGLKRAALMAILYLVAPVVRGKSDAMTALGAACYLIVLTNPREVFDLGFIMSVSAVCGILLFAPSVSALLRRGRWKKGTRWIADGLAMTVAANLFLLPILFNVFGTVSLYSPIGNLLILPVVTVVYTYLAIVAGLTMIIPHLGILFYVIKYPFALIRLIGSFIYSLPYSTLAVGSVGAFCALYIFGLAFLSRLNKLPYKIKIPVSVVCVLASCAGLFV